MVKRIGEIEEVLLVSLHDLVFIDVEYLERYIFVHKDGKSYSRYWISRQMRALEAEGYIKSFPVAKATVRGRDRLVYTLDTKGIEEVIEILGDCDWDTRWTDRTPTYIFHSLRMSQVQGAFVFVRNDDFCVKDYFSERRAFRNYGVVTKDTRGKGRKQLSGTVIRPDGGFVLERVIDNEKYQILFLVELERSRQRIDVTLNKIRRYNEYVQTKAFKKDPIFGDLISMVRVLFISNNDTERNQLLLNAKKGDSFEIEKIGGALLFGIYDEVLANPYGEIWKAANSTNPEKVYSLYNSIE